MKTNLSHILPVWKACEILGRGIVHRIVSSLIRLKHSPSTPGSPAKQQQKDAGDLDDYIDIMVESLFYRQTNNTKSSKMNGEAASTSVDGVSSSTTSTSSAGTGSSAPGSNASLPPAIAQAWKRWLSARVLSLDKAFLLQFLVPFVAQPHTGPSGHMGLYDCWIYALQGHAPTSAATYYGGANNNQLIWLPDVLILLAICKDYRDHQRRAQKVTEAEIAANAEQAPQEPSKTEMSRAMSEEMANQPAKLEEKKVGGEIAQSSDTMSNDDRVVWTMSLLAYRIYDSYQKKGTVTRDTIHRFLTDVHGEESYKEAKAATLLDAVFDDTEHASGWVQITVSESQFCKRVLATMHPLHRTHLLLDWISVLACAMIPPEEIPPSVSAFLDTMHQQPRPISELYQLADKRMFEIKRRFHSLVRSSTAIIQGDPMGSTVSPTSAPDGNDPNLMESMGSNGSAALGSLSGESPRHVITEQAFVDAVSMPNAEMGSGGYMPRQLARWVFRTISNSNSSGGGFTVNLEGPPAFSKQYWGLYQVLQFGCMAVRNSAALPPKQDPDLPLLRFVFALFQFMGRFYREDEDEEGGTKSDGDGTDKEGNTGKAPIAKNNATTESETEQDARVMTRKQVANMILVLVKYASFRRKADSPPSLEPDDRKEAGGVGGEHQDLTQDAVLRPNKNLTTGFAGLETGDIECLMVSRSLCIMLGLVPKKVDASAPVTSGAWGAYIPLKLLVDDALLGATVPNEMSFEDFCAWNKKKVADSPRSRTGPLLLELRMIAAVLFGVPPSMASMEVALVAEIEKRHRHRYPQSDVSRRGPRGTVWYLIDAAWFREWATLVKQVGGTIDDGEDGRGDAQSDRVRGLGRISNTGLLAENGSLSLRADIRWKHDYEILPPLAWSGLQAWYDGGPPIHRTVVRYVASAGAASPHSNKPRIPTENEIELYPFFVRVYLCDVTSRGEARPFQQNFQLSRVSPVRVMLVQLCKELDVDPDAARLWVMGSDPISSGSEMEILGSGNSSQRAEDWILDLDTNIVDQRKRRASAANKDQIISPSGAITLLLELKDKETGLWPRGIDGKEWTFREKSSDDQDQSSLGDGIVGLYNMGNTCYINSSIQCLSHTPIFREYFNMKGYLKDVNSTNPLGHKGQLAQVSAVLINSIWKRFNQTAPHQPNRVTMPGSYAMVNAPSLTPKTFRDALGKFNAHFSGNEQHDAQEFLAFLLDGLSEDLNRIVEKPYIEAPDSDGRPDSELADIWWSNHLRREMSIIVALFTGQYKSLLTCRTCTYESARFEPFLFLQLPLPEDDCHSVSLIFYPRTLGVPTMKYCLRVKNDGTLGDVLVELAKVLHADELQANGKGKEGGGNSETSDDRAEQKVAGEEKTNGDDKNEDKQDEKHELYKKMTKNMAVVDMREGYIAKIAPLSWSLQDLQNKETCELPLLHVYELDPLPETSSEEPEPATSASTTKEDDNIARDDEKTEEAENKPRYSFLAVAQRRSELISRDHLHPLAQRVFGTPLLLRIYDLESYTGRDVYDLVARRLMNFVPKGAQRFLSHQNPQPTDATTDEESSSPRPQSKYPRNLTLEKTTTDMEEVSAGPMPRYGFRLRMTTRDGRRSLSSPWYECSIGCLIPDDDAPTVVLDGDSIVVDWHFAVDVATNGFGLRTYATDPLISQAPLRSPRVSTLPVKNHSSCGSRSSRGAGGQGAVSLEECLDSFAAEERIPEAYCSRCKDFRVQTMRVSLWRLPPIVIIHLKRFQFTQHMRRKLRDLVVFPVEGLDLSRVMAHDSVKTTTVEPDADKQRETTEATEKSPAAQEDGAANGAESAPAVDRIKDTGRSEMLYDLYGVVHHQGALSGGHYVASIKSEVDGQWRLFNDAQIYEIHARDVVDASAYILFYIRRDVSKGKLSDFWDLREGEGVSEEQMDELLKKNRRDRCVVS